MKQFSLTILAVVSVAFSATVTAVHSAPAVSGAPVELNAVIPQTGPAAFVGKSQQQGLEALEALVNRNGGIKGRPLKISIADSQSNPQVDVQLVSGLIARHVAAFVDGAPSALCNASAPLIEKAGPIDFCLSPNLQPAPGGYLIAAGPIPTAYANVGVRYLRERGLRRIAMLTATDASGMSNERLTVAATQLPENRSVQLLADEQFSPTDVSVAAQIAHIKGLNPQAIIVYTTGTPTATVLRALKDAGLDIPVVASAANMNIDQLKSYAGFAPKDLLFAAPLPLAPQTRGRGDIEAAIARFRNTFISQGIHPDVGMLTAWDPVLLYVDALRKLGPDANASQLHDYIVHQRSWVGAMGEYDFVTYPQRGLGEDALIIARWEQGRSEFSRASKPGGHV